MKPYFDAGLLEAATGDVSFKAVQTEGSSADAARAFLDPGEGNLLDPLALNDMDRAAARLRAARVALASELSVAERNYKSALERLKIINAGVEAARQTSRSIVLLTKWTEQSIIAALTPPE